MPPAPTNGSLDADLMDEIADYLCASLNMVAGQDFFVGELPEPGVDSTPLQDGIYMVELPGPGDKPESLYLDTETHIVEFWSSSSDSKQAKILLRRVWDVIQRKANYALVNWYVYFSYASATIRDEGRGREGNKLFSLGFTFICRNLNNIS